MNETPVDPIEMEVSQSLFDILLLELVYHTIAQHKNKDDKEDMQEMSFYRLEQLGYNIGYRLVMSHVQQVFASNLEIIKFICKDFWSSLFGKQIDTLKTNHRDTFVLTDQNLALLHPFLSDPSHRDTPLLTVLYMAVPCGLIRGALAGNRVKAVVRAQLSAFPICTFDVQIN
jgi:trafficking protein particle complex subunit 6